MNSTPQLNKSDLALCRSAFYEAVSLGFRPPCQETVNRLLAEEQNLALAEIAAILDEQSTAETSDGLSTCVRKLPECADVHDIAALESSYRYCFGHTAHSKVAPYETEYGEETLFQQPQQLSDISGFYEAFGLRLNLEEHERVDHISCECEFLSFLNRKEAYALEQRDSSMLQETRKAQKLFLKDHLARFTPSFSNLLLRENPHSFYSAVGKLCHEFVLMECRRFAVPHGPEQLRLRPKVLVDDCYTCGSGEEIIRDMCDTNSCANID